MNLRARVSLAATGITAVTFALAFPAVFYGVNALEERQLDTALLEEAKTEAKDGDVLAINNRPAPAVGKLGHLTKYGAVFGSDGSVVFATSTFNGEVPAIPGRPEALVGSGFNFWFRREYLRGAIVPESRRGAYLLLAVPRSYLDGDDEAMVIAMWVVFALAVVWGGFVNVWVVGRLTRYHEAIATVARRVARGDLSARIGQEEKGDPQSAQLARDIDEMITRLAQLVGSQKRFIAYAAHELRSPLTVLYGELAHARHGQRDAESYRYTIEEAFDATQRLKVLTEDLLELARLGVNRQLTISRFEIAELLDKALKSTNGLAAEKRIEVRLQSNSMQFDGCAPDLERMLRNLIENAVDHSPEGSTVDVSARALDDSLELSVTDHGPGVRQGEEERIFEPFYRGGGLNGAVHGAGLGLAIVREIARTHGGDVSVQRAPGGGARFVVRLPLREPTRDQPGLDDSDPGSRSTRQSGAA
jgi:two-component system OmpR family sensor kinase